MWRDESVSVQVSRRGLGEMFGLLVHVDAVHGVYYGIGHVLLSLTGGGVVALRLLAVLGYALTATIVASLGAQLAGLRVGMFSGLVYALLPISQMYAQEARSYALVSLFVAAACLTLVKNIRRPSPQLLVLYSVFSITAIWLNEVAILALISHSVFVLSAKVSSRVRLHWAIAAATIAVLALPILILGHRQQVSQIGWITKPDWSLWCTVGAQILVVIVSARTLPAGQHSMNARTFVISMFCAPQLLLLAASQFFQPVYVDRYVEYSYIGFSIAIGAAVSKFIEKSARMTAFVRYSVRFIAVAGLVAALAPWSVYLRSPDSRKDNVSAIQAALRLEYREGDGVVFIPARRREWIMTNPHLLEPGADLALRTSGATSDTLDGIEWPLSKVVSAMENRSTIVVVCDEPLSADGLTDRAKLRVLQTDFELVSVKREHGGAVYRYERIYG